MRQYLLSLLLLSGCGSSSSVSGPSGSLEPTPLAAQVAPVDLEGSALEGAAPTQAIFNLALQGNHNAIPGSLVQEASTQLQAVFSPKGSGATTFQAQAQNVRPAPERTRFFDLRVGLDNRTPLAAGQVFSANSQQSGPRAQMVYGETVRGERPFIFLFQSTAGSIRVLEVVQSDVGSRMKVLFEQVEMQPRAVPNNLAQGRFIFNGEATFRF